MKKPLGLVCTQLPGLVAFLVPL